MHRMQPLLSVGLCLLVAGCMVYNEEHNSRTPSELPQYVFRIFPFDLPDGPITVRAYDSRNRSYRALYIRLSEVEASEFIESRVTEDGVAFGDFEFPSHAAEWLPKGRMTSGLRAFGEQQFPEKGGKTKVNREYWYYDSQEQVLYGYYDSTRMIM